MYQTLVKGHGPRPGIEDTRLGPRPSSNEPYMDLGGRAWYHAEALGTLNVGSQLLGSSMGLWTPLVVLHEPLYTLDDEVTNPRGKCRQCLRLEEGRPSSTRSLQDLTTMFGIPRWMRSQWDSSRDHAVVLQTPYIPSNQVTDPSLSVP